MVPFPWRWICILNPLTYYIKPFQDILFYGRAPSFMIFVTVTAMSTVAFFVSIYLFNIKGKELKKMI